MSRGIWSEHKQVLTFAYTSNRGLVYLLSQNMTTI